MNRGKLEFFVDYYLILYDRENEKEQNILTIPSTDELPSSDKFTAELSIYLDEVPTSWYKWNHEKYEWHLINGKEQSEETKKIFKLPVVIE